MCTDYHNKNYITIFISYAELRHFPPSAATNDKLLNITAFNTPKAFYPKISRHRKKLDGRLLQQKPKLFIFYLLFRFTKRVKYSGMVHAHHKMYWYRNFPS